MPLRFHSEGLERLLIAFNRYILLAVYDDKFKFLFATTGTFYMYPAAIRGVVV